MINLDGQLNEDAWLTAPLATNFHLNAPIDSTPASAPTEVRMFYDEKNLYIGAICRGAYKGDFFIQTLKRDFELKENDAFAIFIDAFRDGNSGLAFGVNPFGVQMDAIIHRGGSKDLKHSWDGRWFAEVYRNSAEAYWSVEIAIPFKTLRFDRKSKNWRINFTRTDRGRNQYSTWAPVPLGFNVYDLSFAGELLWKESPQKQGHNVVMVPYSAVKFSSDYQVAEQLKFTPRVGLDTKLSLNSSINLDFTLNPDFSQVEVDQQVIDLDRFEISFPERRVFFLENNDLFAGLGNSRVRPFWSRRIGSVGNSPVPILFGAHLSGKLNNDWRIGMMSVQTQETPEYEFRSQNYMVNTIERRVFHSSSITAFLTNRQGFEDGGIAKEDYNRVGGLEFNYKSRDSKFTGKAFLHKAFNGLVQEDKTLAYSLKSRYTSRKMSLFLGMDAVGENYLTDMGFVPRLYHENKHNDSLYRIPYMQVRSNGYYRFYPKNKSSKVEYYGPSFSANIYVAEDLSYQEHELEASFKFRLLNSSEFELAITDYSPRVFFPFQPIGMNSPFLAGNYPNRGFNIQYNSDNRKFISGRFKLGYGGEYMGKLFHFLGELNLRQQPWGVFALNYSYRNLSDFPVEYGSPQFSLIGSKIELSLNRKMSFTTFVQYNTQKDNFNFNSRFRWQFKPLSDLYIVYTDNYRIDDFSVKDRALAVKINYWIGL